VKPLREWEKRAIGENGLTRAHADRLLSVARASSLGGADGTRILIDGGKYIRAQNVVGVLAADGCALEILPKIDGVEDEGRVRERLVHMLAVAHDLHVSPGDIASLGVQHETLLEILIRLFADQLIEAVRRGLSRRYIEHCEDLPSLRGRLDNIRQFGVLAADPGRLACRFDSLSPDIALNQVMKAAVHRLRHFARRSETQRRLTELAFAYRDVSDVPFRSLPWTAIHLDRIDRRWKPLVRLAQLLLAEHYQTTSAGGHDGTALIFDMGQLFESYVARSLTRLLAGKGVAVVAQGGLRYCLSELDGSGQAVGERFQTRPDILIKSGASVRLLIDTKWKRLSRASDDRKHGVSQADVYQMMAYGRLYQTPHLMLLYPHHLGLDKPAGVLSRFSLTHGSERLTTATIDLAASDHISHGLLGLVQDILDQMAIAQPG
jgi:5-methylcytosine-specific restriction enzyme subunit McrC